MIYGYCRVSTKGQERYGTSLEEQRRQILNVYPGAQISLEAYSGAKSRPIFEELVGKLCAGDTLVVCKLDRFARSAQQGLDYISQLQGKGVKIHILNMGLIENTPMGKMMVTMLLAFAEFERDTIIERFNAGMDAAKAADPEWRNGRKRRDIPQELIDRINRGEITMYAAAKESGIPRTTIQNYFTRLKQSV